MLCISFVDVDGHVNLCLVQNEHSQESHKIIGGHVTENESNCIMKRGVVKALQNLFLKINLGIYELKAQFSTSTKDAYSSTGWIN